MHSLGEVLTLHVQAYIQTLPSIRKPLSSAVYEQAESDSWTLGEKAESENLRERNDGQHSLKFTASPVQRSMPIPLLEIIQGFSKGHVQLPSKGLLQC